MNRDKQVEDLQKVLIEISKQPIMIEGLEHWSDAIALDLYIADYRKASDVAREFRQRMNEKMGKHTHLLGKEYVQRIMREIEKEFSEVENG